MSWVVSGYSGFLPQGNFDRVVGFVKEIHQPLEPLVQQLGCKPCRHALYEWYVNLLKVSHSALNSLKLNVSNF